MAEKSKWQIFLNFFLDALIFFLLYLRPFFYGLFIVEQ
jgi:hypothetical protein